MARKVKQSDIKEPVTRALWGRSAGRCQFNGCNRALWKSSVTQESANLAERAHIYSASDEGSRGNEGIDPKELNTFENLLLVCDECHKIIDKDKDGGRYTAELLLEWKAKHEERIELVTGIEASKKSHIILYGAPVGDFALPLTFQAASPSLFPEHYPAEGHAISLQMVNSAWRDRDEEFWRVESENLKKLFDGGLRERFSAGDFGHISLFGFAPQPLLTLFGSLLTDIPAAQTYQLHREPPGWNWVDDAVPTEYEVSRPEAGGEIPALVFSLSATITDDRIHAVLGDDIAIWRVAVRTPNRDCIKTRGHLSEFRKVTRVVLDEIKAMHGQITPVNIFPAMPVSAAVDLGRIRMPKADSPWQIYDQINERDGFVVAISIGAPNSDIHSLQGAAR